MTCTRRHEEAENDQYKLHQIISYPSMSLLSSSLNDFGIYKPITATGSKHIINEDNFGINQRHPH